MKLITCLLLVLGIMVLAMPTMGASSWVFAMNDTVRISTAGVQMSDLSSSALPAHVRNLSIGASGMPGHVQEISRKTILRQLVTSGHSRGVSFKGATSCVVIRTGETLNPHALRPEIRNALQHLVPGSKQGAPATWFELELPAKLSIVDDSKFKIRISETALLTPGRNQISVILDGTNQKLNFPVTVILHQFGESAKAMMNIKRGDVLIPALFEWQWVDLAGQKKITDFYGRSALRGVSCTRTIKAGAYLRQSDLKLTPVVLSGDRVELQMQRGTVSVSVNATARQEGSIGQTIPVRNELTKQLVNARVVAPGLVKWRN